MLNSREKLYVFLDIDFGRILEGFWEGFGRPKSLIFAFFSSFFRCKILIATWKGKKSKKKGHKKIFPFFLSGMCGPGGKDIGWGEALPKSEISSQALR